MNESTICDECNIMFIPTLTQDIEFHQSWHERLVYGFRTKKSKYDKVVWDRGDLYITDITPNSSLAQRKKAEKASVLANRSLDRSEFFSYSIYRANGSENDNDLHLFLLHSKNRVIGMITTRKKYCAEEKWEKDEFYTTGKITDLIWIIDMVWIAANYRKHGLAKGAIKIIAEYFDAQAASLGWSMPFTNKGRYLAKSISPTTIYVYSSGM